MLQLLHTFQSIDLHALTGWIPERVALRKGSKEFDQDKEFRRVLDRFHKGHCLVTVATGELSDGDADRAGLVPTHAYAMLDVREELVNEYTFKSLYQYLCEMCYLYCDDTF